MAFTIPNAADAFNANQSEIDKVDFDILTAGFTGSYGVISGLDIVQDTGSNMNIKTNTAGTALVAGVVRKLAANVTAAIGAADATNPRFDLVCISDSDTLVVVGGTAASEPVFPAIPASRTVLASVYVPANDTAITTAQVIDKRFVLLGSQGLFLDRSNSTAGPNNVTTQQTLYSYVVKANLLGTTRGLRVKIFGDWQINSNASTVTLRIKLGATTLWQEVTASLALDGDVAVFGIEFDLYNINATNSQRLFGRVTGGNRVTATTGYGDLTTLTGAAGQIGWGDVIGINTLGALDTTADQTLDVTCQLSAAGASNRFEKKWATNELIPL